MLCKHCKPQKSIYLLLKIRWKTLSVYSFSITLHLLGDCLFAAIQISRKFHEKSLFFVKLKFYNYCYWLLLMRMGMLFSLNIVFFFFCWFITARNFVKFLHEIIVKYRNSKLISRKILREWTHFYTIFFLFFSLYFLFLHHAKKVFSNLTHQKNI